MSKAVWLSIVQYPTTVVQCISSGLSNCETFANLICKKMRRWNHFDLSIVLSSTYVFKLDITLERYLGNAIFATLHHFRWTIWADIRNITLEKKLENITIVTNNLFYRAQHYSWCSHISRWPRIMFSNEIIFNLSTVALNATLLRVWVIQSSNVLNHKYMGLVGAT